MIYFEIRKIIDGGILASNMNEFEYHLIYEEQKNQTDSKKRLKSRYDIFGDVSVWIIIVNEEDLYKSNKLLKRIMKSYADCSNFFLFYYSKKINDHSHALRTIQAQMKHKIHELAIPESFRGENYRESKANIEEIILSDSLLTADTFCYLNKRVLEIEMHIGGFDLLYGSVNNENIKCKKVNIKRVLQNIMAPFLDVLNEQKVTINFSGLSDDYASSNQIKLNYKIFHLAMYNFFSNITKYAKPYSDIKIKFAKDKEFFEIIFDMMSCRIDKDEVCKIFEDGYCGRYAFSSGDGIGMFVARKALKMIDMNIFVNPNYSISENFGSEVYVQNIFKINNM